MEIRSDPLHLTQILRTAGRTSAYPDAQRHANTHDWRCKPDRVGQSQATLPCIPYHTRVSPERRSPVSRTPAQHQLLPLRLGINVRGKRQKKEKLKVQKSGAVASDASSNKMRSIPDRSVNRASLTRASRIGLTRSWDCARASRSPLSKDWWTSGYEW